MMIVVISRCYVMWDYQNGNLLVNLKNTEMCSLQIAIAPRWSCRNGDWPFRPDNGQDPLPVLVQDKEGPPSFLVVWKTLGKPKPDPRMTLFWVFDVLRMWRFSTKRSAVCSKSVRADAPLSVVSLRKTEPKLILPQRQTGAFSSAAKTWNFAWIFFLRSNNFEFLFNLMSL